MLVDLPAFGRPTRLRWIKRRWRCPDPRCEVGSWTEVDPSIAGPRLSMTTRAGKWACAQVGKCGRTVSEVADELGCDWHTINDAVLAYGEQLVDHPDRIGDVTALGLVGFPRVNGHREIRLHGSGYGLVPSRGERAC